MLIEGIDKVLKVVREKPQVVNFKNFLSHLSETKEKIFLKNSEISLLSPVELRHKIYLSKILEIILKECKWRS